MKKLFFEIAVVALVTWLGAFFNLIELLLIAFALLSLTLLTRIHLLRKPALQALQILNTANTTR